MGTTAHVGEQIEHGGVGELDRPPGSTAAASPSTRALGSGLAPLHTLEAELRRLARADLLILDDFALRPLDATETSDSYQLVVERHRKASTVGPPTANWP